MTTAQPPRIGDLATMHVSGERFPLRVTAVSRDRSRVTFAALAVPASARPEGRLDSRPVWTGEGDPTRSTGGVVVAILKPDGSCATEQIGWPITFGRAEYHRPELDLPPFVLDEDAAR